MSRQPHLLMVLNDMAWFWSHRLPLANAILERGWKLSLTSAGAADDKAVTDMGIEGFNLPTHGGHVNPLVLITRLFALARIIRQTKPDIIHAITLRYAFYTGLVCRVIGYGPIVFTIAGLGSLFSSKTAKMQILRFLIRPLLKLAFSGQDRFIIFQNPDDRKAMLDAGIVKEEQVALIRGSGVDLTEFPLQPLPQDEDPIILFTSRLVKEKGIHDFVEAARILKEKGARARFQVAGDIYPNNPNSLTTEEIQSFHDEGVIEWLGQCSGMPQVLASSYMIVLPSYYGEGVPKVLLEAAATGRPIITCDAPGCREAVQHEVNGLLVPPQNAQELAKAIESLLNDPAKAASLGQEGRRHVESDFTVETVVKRTLEVYDNALKQ